MRKIRIAAFCSHYWGAAAFDALNSLSPWLEVVWVGTDDPLKPYTNAKGRIWSLGWDEKLRLLVSDKIRASGLTAETGRIRDQLVLDSFMNARPEAILCCTYGQKIPETLLNFVRRRAVNLHPTSPKYGLDATRGPRAMESAIELGDCIDVSAHRMSKEFDDGEILARSTPVAIPFELRRGNPQPQAILEFYKVTASTVGNLVQDHLLRILAADYSQIVD